ncbi:hypothetical protein ACIGG9_27040 [Pseudonocardia alni]|uniref:hypothetical protein n=1 Tax=Pseudonocardia alni TaxID=33907 RepID=UPI0033CDCB70
MEASDDDAAPAALVVGTGEVSEVQESIAPQLAATVRELGHVEPAGGPDGDLRRVRLTPAGRDRLAE